MELSECISMTKDIIVALAAVSTVIIAYMGLNKWKAELKGKVYFDTARNLIKVVYKVRDQIRLVRSSFMLDYEFPSDYNPLDKNAEKKANAYVYLYQNRMKPLRDSLQELDVYVLEYEALWDNDIKEKAKKLSNLFFQLESSIKMYIEDVRTNGEFFRKNEKLEIEIWNNIHESLKQDDMLSLEINNSITEIEKIVRPHLDNS
ncbi:conserved hypothetical protein [Arcobacter nitrofigilis DSM 7299]|uniref:Uncharacterized protein n=1 Tax=Arcobacter nitrofigilis (strain ATCC 33309 / DSM 7299 / CCUG 15893 / LMG 7604 / NCTC 12251 / CI) TaxID=572480 RepID=D5V3T4_ARCNC|nr:hypothetical protein [Arcobacter nitrofigilis]ADG92762.1 conserved hypothetical protein [Arcobacter nitrofigilis DSM 7299]